MIALSRARPAGATSPRIDARRDRNTSIIVDLFLGARASCPRLVRRDFIRNRLLEMVAEVLSDVGGNPGADPFERLDP